MLAKATKRDVAYTAEDNPDPKNEMEGSSERARKSRKTGETLSNWMFLPNLKAVF